MAEKNRLTKKQLAVLDDLFGEDASAGEGQILEKHAVKPVDYRRWHGEEAFSQEFSARMECLSRQSRLLIARYASYAAAKLIALTESENQETARKACLDIIDRLQNTEDRKQKTEGGGQGAEDLEQLTPEAAEKILAVLADRG